MSKLNCIVCDNKGNIGMIGNIKEDTVFLLKGWYRDNNGLNHQLIICTKCGTFHDCIPTFLGMFIKKPFKIVGYMTKEDVKSTIEKSLWDRGIGEVDDRSLHDAGINNSIFDYLYERGVDYNIVPNFLIDD